jgi:hypothetical protein
MFISIGVANLNFFFFVKRQFSLDLDVGEVKLTNFLSLSSQNWVDICTFDLHLTIHNIS